MDFELKMENLYQLFPPQSEDKLIIAELKQSQQELYKSLDDANKQIIVQQNTIVDLTDENQVLKHHVYFAHQFIEYLRSEKETLRDLIKDLNKKISLK